MLGIVSTVGLVGLGFSRVWIGIKLELELGNRMYMAIYRHLTPFSCFCMFHTVSIVAALAPCFQLITEHTTA